MNIQSTIASMSTAEKVGQMFMLAFAADQLDEARVLMAEHLVGGAYIGDDNVPTAAAALKLCNTLQAFAAGTRLGIPLLLGADQEGTWSVMTAESAMGPGNMALGATGDPDCAYRMYSVIARETGAVGLECRARPGRRLQLQPAQLHHRDALLRRRAGAGRRDDRRRRARTAGQRQHRRAEALPRPRRYHAGQPPRLAHRDAQPRRPPAHRPAALSPRASKPARAWS